MELDDRVIELVGPHYLKDPRVRVHHSDAVEQMKIWAPGERWDVGWTDIWPDISPDNLPQTKEFGDFYGERCGFHGNWSQDIAKRLVWDNRYFERAYLEFLTEEDRERFEAEDEDEDWDDERLTSELVHLISTTSEALASWWGLSACVKAVLP